MSKVWNKFDIFNLMVNDEFSIPGFSNSTNNNISTCGVVVYARLNISLA